MCDAVLNIPWVYYLGICNHNVECSNSEYKNFILKGVLLHKREICVLSVMCPLFKGILSWIDCTVYNIFRARLFNDLSALWLSIHIHTIHNTNQSVNGHLYSLVQYWITIKQISRVLSILITHTWLCVFCLQETK